MTDESILAAHVNAIAPDIALSPSPFEGSGDRSSPFLCREEIEALTFCIFHDAIPYRFATHYLRNEATQKAYYRRFRKIDLFDFVLCNSEFTASEYRDIFSRDNSIVIGAGLSKTFTELLKSWSYNSSSLGAKLGDYALYVGGLDWRKNLPTLVLALSHVPECAAGDLKLVVAGDIGDLGETAAPLRAAWMECGLAAANLITTGWISDEELADLYRNAAVSVQPSIMEGFGLTALEAMAAGCPIISARGGALAEVVLSEELLFDPESSPQLSLLISRILNDNPFRERMIAFGLDRANNFSLENSARIALDAMANAMQTADRARRPALKLKAAKQTQRLVMDVTSTAMSPVMSGIQRVMHKLSSAMIELNKKKLNPVVLSYCRDSSGWYELPLVAKNCVTLDPQRRIPFQNQDTYLLLDSSWDFTIGQRPRLLDALVMGQEVVHGIHDLGPLTMSAMTDKNMPHVFRAWFEFVLGHSTGIICVSRSVADKVDFG